MANHPFVKWEPLLKIYNRSLIATWQTGRFAQIVCLKKLLMVVLDVI